MNPVKINDTTYEVTLSAGDRVEIGDKDSADFKPCAKLNRWGTECSLVLSIPTNEEILPTIQNEKILWQGRDYGAEFFAATDGFKFNIILPEKPSTNVFPLDFGSDNLKFFYQPPLTEELELERLIGNIISITETDAVGTEASVHRPENVVGSYAVYHATKGNIHASAQDAEKYKVGKAFHWYRPLIYDNAGHTCWGILKVDPKAGLRTVTIPQEFLDSAVYPVTIDDEFGYHPEAPASYLNNPNYCVASVGISPVNYTHTASSGDTITKFSMYGSSSAGATGFGVAAYTLSGQVPVNRLAAEVTIILPSSPAWADSAAVSQEMSDGVSYCCAYGNDGAATERGYYDTGYGVQGSKDVTTGALPAAWTHNNTFSILLAIYCTYTPGGGATEKTGSDSGAGAEAKASGNPLAAISGAESGSGVDSLPFRDMALPEAGSGVDALVSLQTPAAKTSSDAGSGVEAMPVYSAVLADVESGSGIEAFIARLLATAEAGYGAEASEIGGGGLLKHLFASELGEGADRLTAKIEIPNKGGGMRLWT
jgi:hypothetical protein